MYISSRSELSEFRRRYRWMRLFVVLTFLVLVGRLVQLQIVDGREHRDESISNVVRKEWIPAVRGRIFDAKGRVIATSIPSHAVAVIPHYFDTGKGFARLVEFLGLSEADAEAMMAKISERLANPKDMRRFQQITVADGISQEQLAAIKSHEDELPGVQILDVPVRYYPYGNMASHLIGYMNEVNADDIKKPVATVEDPYRASDRIGRSGLERKFEAELRGVRGWRKKTVDARGLALTSEEAETLVIEPKLQEPRPGSDITLTIDMGLQKIVDESLRGHPSAAVMVMDVHSGRILAAASKPSFDPNLITRGLTAEENRALDENPFRPRIDKTIYENYFPGSVFKPFTAMAALEEGIVTSEDVFHCSGFHEFGRRTFRCPKPHGDLTLREGITVSCNVLFYNLAEMTGMDRIAKYAREFGFGARTGAGYNSEAAGSIPTRAWYDEKFPGQFRIGFTLNAAIGQGNTKVTLMQVVSAYSAIANGGTLYRPQVIRRIETPEGDVVKEFHPEIVRRTAVSQRSLDLIMEALTGVVEDKDGTAYGARDPRVSVAGKTGTAQVARRARQPGDDMQRFYYMNRDHAWFAAVTPAAAPEIAIVVLIEHGGAGGENAAPVGIEIARRYFDEVAPREEAPLVAEKNDKARQRPKRVVADETEAVTASTHRR
ncbi:MAG: penicillin-binding protein 2 [Deltaproteobacteria bacterium]|nr:penicillin-binding protein 2 [Deltaproteobacteria bacterium]